MFDRIAVVVAALLSLAACGLDDFEDIDPLEADTALAPADVWSDVADIGEEPGDEEPGDEDGDAGGEGGEPLPDLPESEPELVDACCVCGPFGLFDSTTPWCGSIGGPESCAELQAEVEMPTEWHSSCVVVDGLVQCAGACEG